MLSKKLFTSYFDRFDELLLNRTAGASTISDTEEVSKRQQWQTNYLSLSQQLQALKGSLSEPMIAVKEPIVAVEAAWDVREEIQSYLSLLELLMSGLEQNLHQNLRLRLETEIGINFIDQAEKFFSIQTKQSNHETQSIHFYAAVTVLWVGAILERTLHTLSRQQLQGFSQSYDPDEYAQLNHLVNSLEDKGCFDSTIAQQVCFWLTLREKVMMNQPEQLDISTIRKMIDGTRNLLEKLPSL
jgi:hypothetical protein